MACPQILKRGHLYFGQRGHYDFALSAGDVSLTSASLFTMVRDTRYKAVHILGSEDGQLFDLQADPGELRNLWRDPAHAAVREAMTRSVLEWRMRTSVETMNLMETAR